MMNRGTLDWLDETDVSDTRWERLIEEYEGGLINLNRLLVWLDAAYGRGYNDAKNEGLQ